MLNLLTYTISTNPDARYDPNNSDSLQMLKDEINYFFSYNSLANFIKNGNRERLEDLLIMNGPDPVIRIRPSNDFFNFIVRNPAVQEFLYHGTHNIKQTLYDFENMISTINQRLIDYEHEQTDGCLYMDVDIFHDLNYYRPIRPRDICDIVMNRESEYSRLINSKYRLTFRGFNYFNGFNSYDSGLSHRVKKFIIRKRILDNINPNETAEMMTVRENKHKTAIGFCRIDRNTDVATMISTLDRILEIYELNGFPIGEFQV